MISRIVQSADFERVLGAPSRSRSAHFALHHLALGPLPARKPHLKGPVPSFATDLSTGLAPSRAAPVDDLPSDVPLDTPSAQWLGYVVPKRHAKRAVTRNLLKRQIRTVFATHASCLPAGQWLVRLRSPFAAAQFVSARSDGLAEVVRGELEQLFARAAGPAHPPVQA